MMRLSEQRLVVLPTAFKLNTELHDEGVVIPTALGSLTATTMDDVIETFVVAEGVVMLIEMLDPIDVVSPQEDIRRDVAMKENRMILFIIPPFDLSITFIVRNG